MPKKKSHQQFMNELNDIHGDNYIIHEEYTNTSTKILTEHAICGHKWKVFPNNLLRGKSKCPSCSGKHNRTPQEFSDYVIEKTNGEFSSMGDFKGNNHIATFKHNTCGYIFKSIPQIVQKGEIGCRNCSNMLVHTKERVEFLLEDKYGTEYILLSDEVKNNRDEIELFHSACKKSFNTNSTSIINMGKGCSHCNINGSKGELKIESILKENKIKYVREFTFNDCRYKNLLFFDFAIFDENKKLLGLIEFDGKQHFEPIDFFGGEDGYKLTKLRDDIKNKYCDTKDISLLRIPYWEEGNLEAIIKNHLNDTLNINSKEVA